MDERKSPLLWSSEATADFDGIWDYYEHAAGAYTAEDVTRRIHHICAVLTENPFAGRPRDEIRPDLHSLSAFPFVVFYQIGSGGIPEIIRVLDGRQDIDSAFSEVAEH